MTGDATLRSIYSAADETTAALERLHQADRLRRTDLRRSLDAAVVRLDAPAPPQEFEPAPERRERPGGSDRREQPPDPPPFVALPQRTTHGGPFGPAVRERIIAAALAKRTW